MLTVSEAYTTNRWVIVEGTDRTSLSYEGHAHSE